MKKILFGLILAAIMVVSSVMAEMPESDSAFTDQITRSEREDEMPYIPEVKVGGTTYRIKDKGTRKSLGLFEMTKGYIEDGTGEIKTYQRFCRTIDKIPISADEKLNFSFNKSPKYVKAFVSYYNGSTYVKNEDLSGDYVTGIPSADSCIINFMFASDIEDYNNILELAVVTKVSKKIDSIIDSVNPEFLTWEQGYINSEDGHIEASNYGAHMTNHIPMTPGDVVDITLDQRNHSGASFYVVQYDPDGTIVGLLTPENNTNAFMVTGVNGWIRVAIHNTVPITVSEMKDWIDIRIARETAAETLFELQSNVNDFISRQDYFENALDHFDIVWMKGYFVSASTGIMAQNAQAAVSGLLKVEPGSWYQTNYSLAASTVSQISYYDENAVFIGAKEHTSKDQYHQLPDNCYYVRLNSDVSEIDGKYFVRPSHINDVQFTRDDQRIFISRWFKNRCLMNNSTGREIVIDVAYDSDYVEVEPNSYYIIEPQSSLYGGDYLVAQYDENKEIINTFARVLHYFITSENCKYIRFNSSSDNFKNGSCYIRKAYNKDTDAINATFINGFHQASDGEYRSNNRFICTSSSIDVSEKKKLDIYHDTIHVGSVFVTLYNSLGFVHNVSFNYDTGHIEYIIPDYATEIHINIMADGDSISPSDSNYFTICLSKDTNRREFNVADYVENAVGNRNYLVQASSKSNLLPVGLDYDPETYEIAFTKEDVSSDIISRGLDAPCVFWDSIMCRWGITFTAYRRDEVSEYGSIYAAHSDDLVNWVQDGVIIERSINDEYAPDYGTVGGSYVFIKDGKYHVFYNGGSGRGFEEGKYTICLAVGESLGNLTKIPENPIVIGIDDGNWYTSDKVYRPSVIEWGNGTYYMFLNARRNNDDGTGFNLKWHEYLGYAVSSDLIHWKLQGQVLDDMPEREYDHYVTGDPCFYDIGDDYIYATLFTCFNETGLAWMTNTGVGIMRTTKNQFPVGWKMVKNNVTGHPYTKSYVVYKGGVQYAFMVDTGPAIYYRTSEN